jgi:hypothetical protein
MPQDKRRDKRTVQLSGEKLSIDPEIIELKEKAAFWEKNSNRHRDNWLSEQKHSRDLATDRADQGHANEVLWRIAAIAVCCEIIQILVEIYYAH